MKRMIVVFLLVALTLYLGWRFGAPYFDTRHEQDACEFGPVSNATYRELLAEAKRRNATVWPPLREASAEKEKAKMLSQRIDDLSSHAKTLYKKFAAVHAVMRERGGYLAKAYIVLSRFPSDDRDAAGGRSPQTRLITAATLRLSYFVHSDFVGNVEGWVDPVFSEVGIGIEIEGEVADTELQEYGNDVVYRRAWNQVRVHQLNALGVLLGIEGELGSFFRRYPSICPGEFDFSHVETRSKPYGWRD
jgi:hypothetical protein